MFFSVVLGERDCAANMPRGLWRSGVSQTLSIRASAAKDNKVVLLSSLAFGKGFRAAHGSRRRHPGRRKGCALAMNGSLPRPSVNAKVVNENAPELFPVMYLVKIWFIRRGAEGRRAFDQIEISWNNFLK
jgi:hypothetical protein